jgi:RNA polymerase sigma factor (sigma-70 family)
VDPAVVELIRRHGAQVMSTARRYSASPEDAEDAYQRAVEILLTRAPCADPDELVPWLKTVVKHEAFALRRQRARHGMPGDADAIEPLAGSVPGPAELAERRDRLRVGAEALRRLKPQEVRALTLKAQGLSYQEICAATGWSYTKVNRCLAEGRKRFLARVAGIEAGAECDRLAPLVSSLADGELRGEDLAVLRGHLHGCLACRARLREYRGAPARAAALVPAPLVASLWHAAAGWLHAHKLAAVVASSVVMAGGGTVAVRTLEHPAAPPAPERTHVRRTPARARPPLPSPVLAPRSRPLQTSSDPGPRAQPKPRPETPAPPAIQQGGEFAPGPAAEPATPAPAPAAPEPRPSGDAGGEFAP